MGGRPGEEVPQFSRGDPLSAANLQKIVDLFIKRIIGAPPIMVSSNTRGLVISLSPSKAGVPAAQVPQVVGVITSHVGQQTYIWTPYSAHVDIQGDNTCLNINPREGEDAGNHFPFGARVFLFRNALAADPTTKLWLFDGRV